MGESLPRYVLLRVLTRVIARHDPYVLGSLNELEYENEALSILSRFAEAGLEASDDAAGRKQMARTIVKNMLTWWYADEEPHDDMLDALTNELLGTYMDSHDPAKFSDNPMYDVGA